MIDRSFIQCASGCCLLNLHACFRSKCSSALVVIIDLSKKPEGTLILVWSSITSIVVLFSFAINLIYQPKQTVQCAKSSKHLRLLLKAGTGWKKTHHFGNKAHVQVSNRSILKVPPP